MIGARLCELNVSINTLHTHTLLPCTAIAKVSGYFSPCPVLERERERERERQRYHAKFKTINPTHFNSVGAATSTPRACGRGIVLT